MNAFQSGEGRHCDGHTPWRMQLVREDRVLENRIRVSFCGCSKFEAIRELDLCVLCAYCVNGMWDDLGRQERCTSNQHVQAECGPRYLPPGLSKLEGCSKDAPTALGLGPELKTLVAIALGRAGRSRARRRWGSHGPHASLRADRGVPGSVMEV